MPAKRVLCGAQVKSGKRKGLSCTRSASWLVNDKPRCSAHTPTWPDPMQSVTTLSGRDVFAVASSPSTTTPASADACSAIEEKTHR